MRKFKAETASTNEFTDKELESMETLVSPRLKTITMNFDKSKPVGVIEFVKREGSKVFVTGRLNPNMSGLYAVVGGLKTKDKRIITEVAITKNPTDKSLSPLEYVDE